MIIVGIIMITQQYSAWIVILTWVNVAIIAVSFGHLIGVGDDE